MIPVGKDKYFFGTFHNYFFGEGLLLQFNQLDACLKMMKTYSLFKVKNKESRTMSISIYHLLHLWPSGERAGFPILGSRVQNHWVAPKSTQSFILPRSIK